MENAVSGWVAILTACAPILISLIGIIPTIISNRKKTQESIDTLRSELRKDTDGTNRKVDALAKDFATHTAEGEEYKAKQARMRILRFYDELCANVEHSESFFEDILDDCKFYEEYCREHKNFQNHRGQAAIAYIDETYRKIKQKGGFLIHKED